MEKEGVHVCGSVCKLPRYCRNTPKVRSGAVRRAYLEQKHKTTTYAFLISFASCSLMTFFRLALVY
jgi:hypothetical protein